jgi:hypothetical protein
MSVSAGIHVAIPSLDKGKFTHSAGRKKVVLRIIFRFGRIPNIFPFQFLDIFRSPAP